MKKFRQTLAVWLCALAILACVPSQLRAADIVPRPNVILIMLDDLGWADLSCYGSTYHESPNIDQLAKQGMRFTQAYAAAPVCSPTRAALMTGKCPARLHLTNWLPGDKDSRYRLGDPKTENSLPLEEVTLVEHLQAAGYATGHIGKWHLSRESEGPRKQGFDVNIGGDDKGTPFGYFAPFSKRGKDVPHLEWAPPGSYLTDILNDTAVRFIREHREQPFFLYLSHFAVHTPLHAKPHMVAKYQKGAMLPGQQSNPVYAAMIESVDDGIGKIVKELEKLKLTEKTILIFTSDNGGVATVDWPFTPPTVNGSLREGKGHLYEGGIRVPLIVRWPGNVKAGVVCETPVTTMDFLPTILEMCGVDKNAIKHEQPVSQKPVHGPEKTTTPSPATAKAKDTVLDGVSILPLLRQSGDMHRDALYWHFPHYSPQHGRPGGAIRVGDFKLVAFYEDDRRELYNLKSDPSELHNLALKEPERVRDLETKFTAWRKSVGAQMMQANPDYLPNPQQSDSIVSMHARTADVHGSMLRFHAAPHLDMLGYWGLQQDWVSFDFQLTEPGKFDLELLYSCRKENAGSLLEITLDGQKVTHVVKETKERKFEPRNIATLELSRAGRYTLAIKPQSKPGNVVMELRRVRLLPSK
ncbi:MAG: sulfatase [Pirellulaceae bacterium]